MCAPEGCRFALVAESHCPCLARSGRSWALCRSFGRSGGVGTGSGERSRAAGTLGGGAVGLVSERNRVGGRGLAHLAAPIRSEKIGIRGGGRAAFTVGALRFLCHRARRPGSCIERTARPGARASSQSAPAHTDRRRGNPRADVACCGSQVAGSLPHRGNPCIRAPTHAGPARGAMQASGPLRGRGPLEFRRRTKKSLTILRRASVTLVCEVLTLDDNIVIL